MAKQAHISIWQRLHLDPLLLLGIVTLMTLSLFVVYSAGGQEMAIVYRQITRSFIAFSTQSDRAPSLPSISAITAVGTICQSSILSSL